MALSLESANLTKQRARAETRKPKIQAALKMLFSYLAQHKGNPDLQFTAFSALATTSVVIADAACRLYALYVKKPSGSTTASFVGITDDDTTASTSSAEMRLYLPTNNEEILIFPDGIPMTTGVVIGSTTTAAGATGSAAADQAAGFGIVGG
jgi:hypothetical protein